MHAMTCAKHSSSAFNEAEERVYEARSDNSDGIEGLPAIK
jgi:hypothetical protein